MSNKKKKFGLWKISSWRNDQIRSRLDSWPYRLNAWRWRLGWKLGWICRSVRRRACWWWWGWERWLWWLRGEMLADEWVAWGKRLDWEFWVRVVWGGIASKFGCLNFFFFWKVFSFGVVISPKDFPPKLQFPSLRQKSTGRKSEKTYQPNLAKSHSAASPPPI